jgi:hypothetical protein
MTNLRLKMCNETYSFSVHIVPATSVYGGTSTISAHRPPASKGMWFAFPSLPRTPAVLVSRQPHTIRAQHAPKSPHFSGGLDLLLPLPLALFVNAY